MAGDATTSSMYMFRMTWAEQIVEPGLMGRDQSPGMHYETKKTASPLRGEAV